MEFNHILCYITSMKKISSITALGVLVLIIASPYIAITGFWKTLLLIICALAIIILSYLIRLELHRVLRIVHNEEEIKKDTYVENNPQ